MEAEQKCQKENLELSTFDSIEEEMRLEYYEYVYRRYIHVV